MPLGLQRLTARTARLRFTARLLTLSSLRRCYPPQDCSHLQGCTPGHKTHNSQLLRHSLSLYLEIHSATSPTRRRLSLMLAGLLLILGLVLGMVLPILGLAFLGIGLPILGTGRVWNGL
jgi:hypothetical protein